MGDGGGVGGGGVPALPLEGGGGALAGGVASGTAPAVEATAPRFTTPVTTEKAVFEPWALAARTMRRSVEPTSASATW